LLHRLRLVKSERGGKVPPCARLQDLGEFDPNVPCEALRVAGLVVPDRSDLDSELLLDHKNASASSQRLRFAPGRAEI
jgi:hypothetical protein